jgi:zinc protease
MNHAPTIAFAGLLALPVAALAADVDYAVLVSKQTDADPAWHKVVEKLVAKHHASVVTFEGDIATAKDALAAQMPLYTAIVARPEELGRGFVAKTHRMMRRLDTDPYTDTLWGIVTGFSADDALTLVSDDKPLVMKRAVSTTGVNAGLFEQMFTVSDGSEGEWTLKGADGVITNGGTKDDAERKGDRGVLFSQRFAEIKPDVIVSSSHGFENGIEMPWSHGMLIGRNGELAILPQNENGKGLGKAQKVAASENPKVFLPVGNCLVGHIDAKHTKDSLILALQHSAAVRQSIGYTIETWFGRGGWGTLGLLQSQPGKMTVAEAWFFNQQQLVEDLRTKYPKAAAFDYEWNDKSSVNSFIAAAQKAGISGKEKDEMGLAFDRDVVALYGDPAYDARLDANKWAAPFKAVLDESTSTRTLTITVTDASAFKSYHGPAMIVFTHRCPDPLARDALPQGSILADNFIIVSDVAKAVGEKESATLRFGPGPTPAAAQKSGGV